MSSLAELCTALAIAAWAKNTIDRVKAGNSTGHFTVAIPAMTTGASGAFFLLAAILYLYGNLCYKSNCSRHTRTSTFGAAITMEMMGFLLLLLTLPLWSNVVVQSVAHSNDTNTMLETSNTLVNTNSGTNLNQSDWTGRAEPAGGGLETCQGCGVVKMGRFCGNCGR